MKISTKGRYGLRAMIDLALNIKSGPITLSSIAGRVGVSESYLEQLMNALKKAGLVSSARGHQGGYALSKDPKDISMSIILDVLEGTLAPVHCVELNPPSRCPREDSCASKDVWEKMKDSIYSVIDNISLKDVSDRQSVLNEREMEKTRFGRIMNIDPGVIVIKSKNANINNTAFKGKWLLEKAVDSNNPSNAGNEYSVALTEKGQFFVLIEDAFKPEDSRYSVLPGMDNLYESNILPNDIINKVSASVNDKISFNFLDI